MAVALGSDDFLNNTELAGANNCIWCAVRARRQSWLIIRQMWLSCQSYIKSI